MSEAPTAYLIPANIVVGLLTYLQQRPYHEVAQGIAALQALEPIREGDHPHSAV